MTFEDDLTRRLTERATLVDAAPDLGEVEAGSRRHGRRRVAAAVAGVAVIALGIGGIVLVGTDSDPTRISSTDDSTGSTDDEVEAATAGAENTVATLPSVDAAPNALDVPPAADDDSSTEPEVETDDPQPVVDPVEQYLPDSVELHRGAVGEQEIIVRRSSVNVATLLGLEWTAPTGTEDCFGTSALFIGVPGQRDRSLAESDWWISPEYDDPTRPIALHHAWILEGQDPAGPSFVDSSVFVVLSRTGGDEAVLLDAGEELARAPMADGVALIGAAADFYADVFDPSIAIVESGTLGEPIPFPDVLVPRAISGVAECQPGPPPRPPLPDAGEQPADPVAAEAEIRAVHAALIDRTTPISEDGSELLDDVTGVADAVDRVNSGLFADPAATAEHTIHDVVFTTPDEAWFDYSIESTAGRFERFGMARFDGSVWKVTRQTICQDLALAGGPCEPDAGGDVQPPLPPDWDDVVAAYDREARLYFFPLEACTPYILC